MRVALASGEPALIAYYRFDEAGQTVLDGSGRGATGALGDTDLVEAIDPVRIGENAF